MQNIYLFKRKKTPKMEGKYIKKSKRQQHDFQNGCKMLRYEVQVYMSCSKWAETRKTSGTVL